VIKVLILTRGGDNGVVELVAVAVIEKQRNEEPWSHNGVVGRGWRTVLEGEKNCKIGTSLILP
jgi:hypothetical protein